MAWAMALALVLLPAAGGAEPDAELPILEAYLAPHDEVVVQGRHCARHGGLDNTRDLPDTPHVATNRLLADHVAWHLAHEAIGGHAFSPDDADDYGERFFLYHHEMIHAYEAWRAANGHPPLVPWDPATTIPPHFSTDPSPLCQGRDREHVARPLPTWATLGGGAVADPLWGYTRLCDFPSVNRLAKSLDSGYHSEVHNGRAGGVGGDMDWPWTASPCVGGSAPQ